MAKHSDIDHSGLTGIPDLSTHTGDTSDAHDASAISVLDTAANFAGTDVEAVLAELQDNIDGVSAGGALVPTLLQSPAPGGGNDAEFSGSISPFSAVDGGSGTVTLNQGSGAGVYDTGSRSGWVLLQPGTASGENVELKMDVTLADGACVVAYVSVALDQAGTPSANNEWAVGLCVNDSDTAGHVSSTTTQTLIAQVDCEASGQIRVMAFDGSASLGETATSNTFIGGCFLRIDRSGLVYRAYVSFDGFSWTYLGTKTMGTAANNVWLFANCQATMATRMVFGCPWVRFGTALAVDPIPLT